MRLSGFGSSVYTVWTSLFDQSNFDLLNLMLVHHDNLQTDADLKVLFVCFICHIYPPFTRKRIVSLYFGR